MIRACLAATFLVAALLTGCSSAADSPDESAAALPGPVPDDVSFRTPPKTAPPAPAFDLTLLGGDTLSVAGQWADRPVVLIFFESWCEICKEEQPAINDLVDKYQDVVLFLGIAGMSSEDEVRQYVEDNNVAYPVGTDASGKIWLRYAAEEPPLIALISKGGQLLRGWPGGLSAETLQDQIEELAVS
ncbi:MAG TPA: TlpA disulfide reductase family protein [Nocardioidaceae bacterium]|nr:TlpA disulfide reductase family protein [Nocardioidaceae bacterium]